MRTRALLALLVLATLPLAAAAQPAAQPTIVMPDKVQWTPGTGALAGCELAVLTGDPTKSGPYVLRLRIPDGGKFGAHFHGDTEQVTVLAGTLMVGLGDTMSDASMTALPAGSFVSVPAGVHHYAMAKGLTILQLAGNGPMSMTMVAPGK